MFWGEINMNRDMSNENHPRWKGDEASKISLHIWIAKNKPKPKLCENCGKERKLSLANMRSHNYTRNINDYKWFCYSCHKRMDMGDYCKRGHILDKVDSRGKRFCSICKKIYNRNYRNKKRAGEKLS